MRKRVLLWILFGILIISVLDVKVVRAPAPFVCVLVHSSISNQILAEINRYVADLQAEGLDAHVVVWEGEDDHLAVRTLLQNEYYEGMIGAFLVGNIPIAWYEFDYPTPWAPTWPPEHVEFPMDLFYMDLDGNWVDSDNDGKYDQHSGDRGPEIWVGRLKASNMAADEVSLLKNYFDKNHAYRTGTLKLPYRALIYIDDDWAEAKSSYLDSAVGTIFSDRTLVTDPDTTNATDYLARLQQGYYLVHLLVHGGFNMHSFKIPSGSGGNILSSDIHSADPKAFFYILESCYNARYTMQDYIAGWYIFSATYGLVAISSTKTTYMIWPSDFYNRLAEHHFGYAFQAGIADAIEGRIDAPEFYGNVIIGDPTLKLIRHDIATLSVTPSTNQVIQGGTVTINVTFENQGSVPETFNVRCFSSTKRRPVDGAWVISMMWIDIGTQQVTSLDPGASLTLMFTWDTSGVEEGWYYDISVRAELLNDADPEDNYYSLPFYLFVSPPAPPPTPPTVPEFPPEGFSVMLLLSILTVSLIRHKAKRLVHRPDGTRGAYTELLKARKTLQNGIILSEA